MSASILREDVERLRLLGFDVFPCNPDKTPKVRWQDDPPADGWTFGPDDLIGVRLPVGTVVLDIDDYTTFRDTPYANDITDTIHSATRREGGLHVYYRTEGDQEVPQSVAGATLGYDTRVGGKGYVIAWNPEDWTFVSEWPLAPDFLYQRVGSKGDLLADGDAHVLTLPMGTRTDLLSYVSKNWDGSITTDEFYANLMDRLEKGDIVSLDPERPWTERDLRVIARQGATWANTPPPWYEGTTWEKFLYGWRLFADAVRRGIFAWHPPEEGTLSDALNQTVESLTKYVHFTSVQQAHTVALWCAATHIYDNLDLLPRLAVRAPTRGSGKTRLLEVITHLVRNGWGPLVGPSAASLFRKIEADQPTVLMDEVDRLFERRAEDGAAILEVINAGHVNGATVPRVIGQGTKQTVHDFRVYAPMALAGITTKWSDTALDRSIIVTLERRKDEPIERFRMRNHGGVKDIGKRLGYFVRAADLPDDVKLPDSLSDRAMDNWEPLLRLAAAAGDEWPERAWSAAQILGKEAASIMADDEREEVILLRDIVLIAAREAPHTDFIGSTELVTHLRALEEGRWSEREGNLSTHKLASKLLTFHIRPHTPWGSTKRGYDLKRVREVYDRVRVRGAEDNA